MKVAIYTAGWFSWYVEDGRGEKNLNEIIYLSLKARKGKQTTNECVN